MDQDYWAMDYQGTTVLHLRQSGFLPPNGHVQVQ